MGKQVISLRIDEDLYGRLKEFPDYPDKIRECIKEFLNRVEQEMGSLIESYLNEFLKGRTVNSPVYRCICLKANNPYESVDRSTIKRDLDYSGELELVANLIDEKWGRIIKAHPHNISNLSEELKNSFYNREDYSEYLTWMKNEIYKIEHDEPELFHIVADFIYGKNSLRNDDEYVRENVLNKIYGDGKYKKIIDRFFTCGAARYLHAKKWSAVTFDDNAREYIEEIRKKRKGKAWTQMKKELNDDLFNIIGNYFDSHVGYEPYRKENNLDEKDFNDVRRLIKGHWILFNHSSTYLSPTSIDLIKSYALKKI